LGILPWLLPIGVELLKPCEIFKVELPKGVETKVDEDLASNRDCGSIPTDVLFPILCDILLLIDVVKED
jgi:hypothetical protein